MEMKTQLFQDKEASPCKSLPPLLSGVLCSSRAPEISYNSSQGTKRKNKPCLWMGAESLFTSVQEGQDPSSTELRRGIPYAASPSSGAPMKLFNSIFNSDIVFNLRKEEDLLRKEKNGEVGVSGRDYALIPGEMWLQMIKCEVYEKSLAPFLVPDEECTNHSDASERGATEVVSEANGYNTRFSDPEETSGVDKLDAQSDTEFHFYLQPLRLLPEVFKSEFFSRRPPESVSLYKCLEGFLKEEPLGSDDMWFFPVCKKHCQASKKLDLWRLLEILVIHLKRFSYSRFLEYKPDAYVDFLIHDLDLSPYIAHKDVESSNRYMLYAVSNHYGSMGGGHYTAFVRHDGDQWYDFDDSRVSPIGENKIKSPSAYVCFIEESENIQLKLTQSDYLKALRRSPHFFVLIIIHS